MALLGEGPGVGFSPFGRRGVLHNYGAGGEGIEPSRVPRVGNSSHDNTDRPEVTAAYRMGQAVAKKSVVGRQWVKDSQHFSADLRDFRVVGEANSHQMHYSVACSVEMLGELPSRLLPRWHRTEVPRRRTLQVIWAKSSSLTRFPGLDKRQNLQSDVQLGTLSSATKIDTLDVCRPVGSSGAFTQYLTLPQPPGHRPTPMP